MSNLRPELRPDHTGKMVTRHVRDVTATSPTKKFPAPTGASSKQDSGDIEEVRARLTEILNGYLQGSGVEVLDDDDPDNYGWDEEIQDDGLDYDPEMLLDPEATGASLSSLSNRAISHMKAKMVDADSYSQDYEIAVLHALTHRAGDSQFMEYLTHLHDNATDLYPDVDVLGDENVNSYTLVRDFVDGLRKHEHAGYNLPENIFEATEQERLVMDALHDMNLEISDADGNVEEGLVKIVMDRPQDLDRMFEIIEKRSTRDAIVIRDILESDTPAISDGIL